ncbi:TRIO and F-actin-binding protein-like [Callospermophilus lateralis]
MEHEAETVSCEPLEANMLTQSCCQNCLHPEEAHGARHQVSAASAAAATAQSRAGRAAVRGPELEPPGDEGADSRQPLLLPQEPLPRGGPATPGSRRTGGALVEASRRHSPWELGSPSSVEAPCCELPRCPSAPEDPLSTSSSDCQGPKRGLSLTAGLPEEDPKAAPRSRHQELEAVPYLEGLAPSPSGSCFEDPNSNTSCSPGSPTHDTSRSSSVDCHTVERWAEVPSWDLLVMIPQRPQEGQRAEGARRVTRSPTRGDTAGQKKDGESFYQAIPVTMDMSSPDSGAGSRCAAQHWAKLRGEGGYFSLERQHSAPAQASSATPQHRPHSATTPASAQAASAQREASRASSPHRVAQKDNPRPSSTQQDTPRASFTQRNTQETSLPARRETPRTSCAQRDNPRASSPNRTTQRDNPRASCAQRDNPRTSSPSRTSQRHNPKTSSPSRATQRDNPRASSPSRTSQRDTPRTSCSQRDNPRTSSPSRTTQRDNPRTSSPSRTTQRDTPRTSCSQRDNPRTSSPSRTSQRDTPRTFCAQRDNPRTSPNKATQRDNSRTSCAQRDNPRASSPNRTTQKESSRTFCTQWDNPRTSSPSRTTQRDNPRTSSIQQNAPRTSSAQQANPKASCARWEHLRSTCTQRDSPHSSFVQRDGPGTPSFQTSIPKDNPGPPSPCRSTQRNSPRNPSPHRTNRDIPWASFPLRPTQSDGPRSSSPSRSKQSEVPWASVSLRPTQGDRPQTSSPSRPAQQDPPQTSAGPSQHTLHSGATSSTHNPGHLSAWRMSSPLYPGARGAPQFSSGPSQPTCAVCIGHRDAPRASSPPRYLQHDPFPFFPDPQASEIELPHHDPPNLPPAVCIGHRDAPWASSPPRHTQYDPFPFLPDTSDTENENEPRHHDPPQLPPPVCIGHRDAPRASSPPRQFPEPSFLLQDYPRASTESLVPSTDSLPEPPHRPAPVCIGHRDAPSFSSPPRQAPEPSLCFQDPPGASMESLAPSTDSLRGSPLLPPQVCIGHRDAPRASSPPRHLPGDLALQAPSPPPGSSGGSRGSAAPWETRHNLEREEYTVLADLPPPRRLAQREPGPQAQGSDGGRTRSPGRAEVERLFGQERR